MSVCYPSTGAAPPLRTAESGEAGAGVGGQSHYHSHNHNNNRSYL